MRAVSYWLEWRHKQHDFEISLPWYITFLLAVAKLIFRFKICMQCVVKYILVCDFIVKYQHNLCLNVYSFFKFILCLTGTKKYSIFYQNDLFMKEVCKPWFSTCLFNNKILNSIKVIFLKLKIRIFYGNKYKLLKIEYQNILASWRITLLHTDTNVSLTYWDSKFFSAFVDQSSLEPTQSMEQYYLENLALFLSRERIPTFAMASGFSIWLGKFCVLMFTFFCVLRLIWIIIICNL